MINAPVARHRRRGFNLIELMIALAITASLLSATMVAIDASFMAYQTTTEVASTQHILRLVINRILTMIRTGEEFAPYPPNPQLSSVVESNWIEFLTTAGDILRVEWVPNDNSLVIYRDIGADGMPPIPWDEGPFTLLEGVMCQNDGAGGCIEPFTLEWQQGKARLFRATVNLAVRPDDNMSVDLDGDNTQLLQIVATAMPRVSAYDNDR